MISCNGCETNTRGPDCIIIPLRGVMRVMVETEIILSITNGAESCSGLSALDVRAGVQRR